MWIMLKLSVFSLLAHLANATIIFMMIPRPIGYFHTDPVHMYSESRVSWSNSAILLISTTLHESWEWTKQQSPSKKEEELSSKVVGDKLYSFSQSKYNSTICMVCDFGDLVVWFIHNFGGQRYQHDFGWIFLFFSLLFYSVRSKWR